MIGTHARVIYGKVEVEENSGLVEGPGKGTREYTERIGGLFR